MSAHSSWGSSRSPPPPSPWSPIQARSGPDQALMRVSISWEKSRVEREISLPISKNEYFHFSFSIIASVKKNSLSNLNFREFETEILVHFRYTWVPDNSGVSGCKKVICRLHAHIFWKFLFLFSTNMSSRFIFLLSKLEMRISNFSFYSRFYFLGSRQCLVLTKLYFC